MKHEYTITKVYRRINGYQSETLYEIKNAYFTMQIINWGNCGFDAPKVLRTSRGHTYYLALNTLLKAFYADKLYPIFNVRENETKPFELENYF